MMLMFSIFLFSASVVTGLLAKNPFNSVLWLILSSIFLMIYIWSFCYKWLSMMIALVFIGGMMVMFMYVASIANNEKLTIHFFPFNILSFMFLSIMFFNSFFQLNNFHINSQMTSLFFLEYSIYLLNFLVFYLLFVLLLVVKIVESFKGALKPNKCF